MLIKHSSPLGALYVPALGVDVAPDTPIDVPDRVAGAAPGPWEPVDHDWRDDGHLYRVTDGVWERRDPGSGLLAQDDVWHIVSEEF